MEANKTYVITAIDSMTERNYDAGRRKSAKNIFDTATVEIFRKDDTTNTKFTGTNDDMEVGDVVVVGANNCVAKGDLDDTIRFLQK